MMSRRTALELESPKEISEELENLGMHMCSFSWKMQGYGMPWTLGTAQTGIGLSPQVLQPRSIGTCRLCFQRRTGESF